MPFIKRKCPACGKTKKFRTDVKTCGCGGTNPFAAKRTPAPAAKILILDIETMATLAWVWAAFDTNIIDVQAHGYLLSFAYKWAGDSKVYVSGLDDYPQIFKKDKDFPQSRNDKALLEDLSYVMNRADIIVAHNGQAFDLKTINARLVANNLPPLRPFRVFDTLLELRKNAKFISNKLDNVSHELGIGRKMEHEGFPLWLACAKGDPAAWKKMKAYNQHDIVLLEELYYRLRPYSKMHPNVNRELGRCRKCGSSNIKQEGFVYTNFRRKAREYCFDCHGWQEDSAKK